MSVATGGAAPLEYIVYKITVMKRALIMMLVACGSAVFFRRGLAAGMLVGALIAIANFSLLARHILTMRGFSVPEAKRYIISRFFMQYVIMAAALFIAASKGMDVFIGTAAGLLVIKGSLFLEMVGTKHAQSR